MNTKLPPESFVALAAVAWADGRMSKGEAEGLLHAAAALGLEGDALATVEAATKESVDFDGFDGSGLSAWERLVTYGLACWLARLDGVQQGTEIAKLEALADALANDEVTPFKLKHAASTAFDVAMLPEGRRPDRFDFSAFEEQLRTRLPTIE